MSLQTFSFLFISSLLAFIPLSLCQDNEQNIRCREPLPCGSVWNISYPFWVRQQAGNCSSNPGFELSCEYDLLFITIGPLRYRVLEFGESTLKIAREDLYSDVCPVYSHNTTLDHNIFEYGDNYPNLTVYYGCFDIPGQEVALPNRFECFVNRTNSSSFYLTRDAQFSNYDSLVRCNDHIHVPVNLETFTRFEYLNYSADALREAFRSGFEVRWFVNSTDCKQCIESGGRCGSNSTSFICHCGDGEHVGTCSVLKDKGSVRINRSIIIVIVALVVSAILILFVAALYRYRGRCFMLSGYGNTVRRDDENVEVFMRNWGSLAPKQYTYSEIKKITNSFMEKLGEGGYGSVYKGKLPDGRLVAVKVLNETKGNGKDFINEVSSIGKTSHVNIVTLLGFCYNKKRALVYEFMPNGSLDKFIYKGGSLNPERHLEWKILYEISVGIARGLEYLHRGLNTRIVHFDIKPHNILLDDNFCPKISDFGLSKLSEKKESRLSTFTARGTPGYIAPEVVFRHLGGVSHKSDVYSYGMMILEMVGVRKNVGEVVSSSEVYFPEWIHEYLELGKEIDIQAVIDEEEEEISRKMIIVGLWCIQTNPTNRPSISKVVEMLEGRLQSLQIPPKPSLYSPNRSPERSFKDFSTSFT